MIGWMLSDHTIPRSYRMMSGYGVHTFVLVNAEGKRTYCKFMWKPKFGQHGLVWDECVKLMGCDPDYHRRDLAEAIMAGAYPEWELGVQLIPVEDEDKVGFDRLTIQGPRLTDFHNSSTSTSLMPQSSCLRICTPSR